MISHPFDVRDYLDNPGKYALFRTARIAKTIGSTPGLVAGRFVRIRYSMTAANKVRGNVEMPIYETWTDDDPDLRAVPCLLYACALGDFGL